MCHHLPGPASCLMWDSSVKRGQADSLISQNVPSSSSLHSKTSFPSSYFVISSPPSLPKSVKWALLSYSLNVLWSQLWCNNPSACRPPSELGFSLLTPSTGRSSFYHCVFFSPMSPTLFVGWAPWSSTASALLCEGSPCVAPSY